MLERIIEILIEYNISGYKIKQLSKGLISQMATDKIKKGITENPRQSSLDLLANILIEHYDISRDWLFKGEGEPILGSRKNRLYLEKHGVRFELIEIIDYFVQNKDEILEESEFLRLFIADLVEKGVTKRLNELKEYMIAINSTKS